MLSFTVSADLHKCVINGKTSYTEKQCPTPESEKAITKGTASTLDTSELRQQMADDEEKKNSDKILQEQQRLDSERAELIQKATKNAVTFEEKRQQKAALKLLGAKTATSAPKNVANNIPQTEQCSSDFSCGSGYKCVKAPYQGTGTCMKAFDQNGAPQYSKDLNSVNPNMKERCNVGTTCPIGFHCDINLKACVR